MSNEQDRIKLAEAMGWESLVDDPTKNMRWRLPNGLDIYRAFLPDTDANDDYAVLEWFRGGNNIGACDYPVWDWSPDKYQIGDYARAALKELKEVE